MSYTTVNTEPKWDFHTIRTLERLSIRAFMERHSGYLQGRVLDFGAGTPTTSNQVQPYKDLVQGEYLPVEPGDSRFHIAPPPYDAIICTQVMQYCNHPRFVISEFYKWLIERSGYLVMTYPTNWDEVEDTDLWRFTKAGMERLLIGEGFSILHHERRAEINLGGFRFPLGYGVVARAG